jgi:hypothetical protein
VALQRVLSTFVLLGLLIATAAAFAITERLKLVKSPVFGTFVSKTFSPTCGCARDKAQIGVTLRRGDDVTLTILDGRRRVVRTLAAGEFVPRGRVSYTWDGSTDAGTRAPDGVYRPEIHFARQHRTILLPNPIRLDTLPPTVVDFGAGRATISPDGDHVGDSIRIRYTLGEPGHVRIYLGSRLIIRSRAHKAKGSVRWYGKVDGRPLKAGIYRLTVGADDLAGNVTPAAERRPVVIFVRYIGLVPDRLAVTPGELFTVGVDTDAPHYWWKLRRRHGIASGHSLRERAPTKSGTYVLAVGERRYTARAKVIVSSAR